MKSVHENAWAGGWGGETLTKEPKIYHSLNEEKNVAKHSKRPPDIHFIHTENHTHTHTHTLTHTHITASDRTQTNYR